MANGGEVIWNAVSEFRRIQRYLQAAESENAMKSYELIKDRYVELKAILQAMGVNLSELDMLKL